MTARPAGAGWPAAPDPATPRADTGPGWPAVAAVFVATLAVSLLAMVRMLPYVEPPTGDQPHYLLQTISLTEDGDLDLRNNYTTAESYRHFSAPGRRREGFRGIPVSYPVQPEGHVVVRQGHDGERWHPKHSPGLPLLLVPGWLVGQALAPALDSLTDAGGSGWPGAVVQLALIGAALTISGLALAWYHLGHHGSAQAVADQYEGFFVPTWTDGQLGADWPALALALAGPFVDRQYGLLVFAPVYALSDVGLATLWRTVETRAIAIGLALVALPYVALTADFRVWWGGWSPPARYLAVLTPLLAAPLAAGLLALAGRWWYWLLFGLLAGLGVAMMAVLLLQLGDAEIGQALLSNPSRNPALYRWLAARAGLDLTGVLSGLAPWFGDRRGPLPWPQMAGLVGLFGLLAALAIQALPRPGRKADAPPAPTRPPVSTA